MKYEGAWKLFFWVGTLLLLPWAWNRLSWGDLWSWLMVALYVLAQAAIGGYAYRKAFGIPWVWKIVFFSNLVLFFSIAIPVWKEPLYVILIFLVAVAPISYFWFLAQYRYAFKSIQLWDQQKEQNQNQQNQ